MIIQYGKTNWFFVIITTLIGMIAGVIIFSNGNDGMADEIMQIDAIKPVKHNDASGGQDKTTIPVDVEAKGSVYCGKEIKGGPSEEEKAQCQELNGVGWTCTEELDNPYCICECPNNSAL